MHLRYYKMNIEMHNQFKVEVRTCNLYLKIENRICRSTSLPYIQSPRFTSLFHCFKMYKIFYCLDSLAQMSRHKTHIPLPKWNISVPIYVLFTLFNRKGKTWRHKLNFRNSKVLCAKILTVKILHRS